MLKRFCVAILAVAVLAPAGPLAAKAKAKEKDEKAGKAKEEAKDPMSSGTWSGLALRSIGPAVTSGRVGDLAVHPTDRKIYYVAVASGGVWKTTNAGTTWTPIFDDQRLLLDRLRGARPEEPERRLGRHRREQQPAQRRLRRRRLQVARRRQDAGRTSASTTSEHIGKILIDPRDSNVVYVAAQGPLWGPGGDRGLYKTTDGGKTWKKVLDDQREHRRHRRRARPAQPRRALRRGLPAPAPRLDAHQRRPGIGAPQVDRRRRDLDEAQHGAAERGDGPHRPGGRARRPGRGLRHRRGGRGRSRRHLPLRGPRRDLGEEERPRLGQPAVLPGDRRRPEERSTASIRIDTSASRSPTTAARRSGRLGERWKHVDNHALWIDPRRHRPLPGRLRRRHLRELRPRRELELQGQPAGHAVLRRGDRQRAPFYNVYGGTQDNFTLGGPARNTSANGITNADWFVTQGGDGFQSVVDPEDPNIVYAEAQYGGLVRFDRTNRRDASTSSRSPGPGEPPLRWNWDSPLIISPHSPTPPLLRRQPALPQRRPRRHLDARSAPT